jgi:hypothetical protein
LIPPLNIKPIDKALALICGQKDVNYTTVADKFGYNRVRDIIAPLASHCYGGLREKRFLLPFWEKRRFGAKTPPKISSVNLIEAFNTNISPI